MKYHLGILILLGMAFVNGMEKDRVDYDKSESDEDKESITPKHSLTDFLIKGLLTEEEGRFPFDRTRLYVELEGSEQIEFCYMDDWKAFRTGETKKHKDAFFIILGLIFDGNYVYRDTGTVQTLVVGNNVSQDELE